MWKQTMSPTILLLVRDYKGCTLELFSSKWWLGVSSESCSYVLPAVSHSFQLRLVIDHVSTSIYFR